MAVNIDQLRDGLNAYERSLSLHRTQLQTDFHELQAYFVRLNTVYDGQAATIFKEAWMRTAEWFEAYLEETQQLSTLLQERIQALNQEV